MRAHFNDSKAAKGELININDPLANAAIVEMRLKAFYQRIQAANFISNTIRSCGEVIFSYGLRRKFNALDHRPNT